MAKVTFKIGDGFPSSEPVARFVTVLAMVSNDWLRMIDDLFSLEDEDPDSKGRRVWLFRLQAATHYEAATFISDSMRRFPEVARFVDGLGDDARADCDEVVGSVDPKSAHYLGDWVVDQRNVTFHYPEMQPDKAAHGNEEIANALRDAADLESSIDAGDHFGTVRFRYADEVVVQWLPDAGRPAPIEALREAAMALARFVQSAAKVFMESRPRGTFDYEP